MAFPGEEEPAAPVPAAPAPGRTRLTETERLETFSDGVIAVIITIMALELKPPGGGGWHDLRAMQAPFLIHVLAYSFIGIYWNNHHHLLRSATRISGAAMWANLHLMFWLSLVPFATAWVGAKHAQPLPAAFYGFVALASAIAYFILVRALISADGPGSRLSEAIGRDVKGIVSPVLYVLGIAGAWIDPWISYAFYGVVSVIWFIPDRRLHRHAG